MAAKLARNICSVALIALGWYVLGMGHLLVVGVHIRPRPITGLVLSVLGIEIAVAGYAPVRRLKAEVIFRVVLYVFVFLSTIFPAVTYLISLLFPGVFFVQIILTVQQALAVLVLAAVGASNLMLLYRWGGLGWQAR